MPEFGFDLPNKTQPTKVAGKLRRAVRWSELTLSPDARRMEYAGLQSCKQFGLFGHELVFGECA